MAKEKTEITEYMKLTYKLMQWALQEPSKRGILIVTYDEERNLTGAAPVGNPTNLGIAIANEMEQNKEFCSIVESAVEAHKKFFGKGTDKYLSSKEKQNLLELTKIVDISYKDLCCSYLLMKTSEENRIHKIEQKANNVQKLILSIIAEFEKDTNTHVRDISLEEEIVKDEKGNAKKRIRNISMDVKMY